MDKLTIDTPEQVHLEYMLAGIGSRFMAAFLDSLIQAGLFLVLAIFAGLFGAALGIAGGSGTWAIAMFVLAAFTVSWGYYTLFEVFWKGQTPGKRWAGIRVIKESGRAITVFEAATRNLIRPIDWLPSLYGAGVLTMLLNSKHKRLGDFVAGTLVVHENADRESNLALHNVAQPTDLAYPQAARLTLEEAELIETFLARRIEIPPDVRQQNAHRIAEMIAARLSIPPENRAVSDEVLLEALVREFRNRARLQ